jgi:protein-tyrosine-phosphatase
MGDHEHERLDILFVCLGNLCRSPMAEGIARQFITTRYPGFAPAVSVSSAGISGLEGESATAEAVMAMRERGIDISGHRARKVTREMADSSGLVLVMEDRYAQRLDALGTRGPTFVLMRLTEASDEALKRLDDNTVARSIHGRLGLLSDCVREIDAGGLWVLPGYDYDVPDPIGLPVDGYRVVADRLQVPICAVLRVLLEGVDPPS